MKYTNKKVIEVDDWDELVEKTYGKLYNFQQQDGCQDRGMVTLQVPLKDYDDNEMNDSVPEKINGEERGVKFDAWLSRDSKEWNGEELDKDFVNMWWERNFYPNIQAVANDLYEKGLIEEGKYYINIDW